MAASPPTWKTGDTYPPLTATLQQAAGASVIPLTGASSVKLIAKSTTAQPAVVLTGMMSIASAAGGYVTYSWGPSDTWIADTYNAEFEILWQAGGTETVPNDSYDQFVFKASLDGS